ncbi:RNA-binding protein cabeza [Yasminevirus sp. GU-2018]|uniref:RNA-binding protein cabeza n=1 Tax=Yasminevirus sp. GU-2018 TaxID=2420051 RepID=A0A5K0U9A5_9VIRU|nr:RNA-binding protein cabeza [Yasminevirus sp. GU-2018]
MSRIEPSDWVCNSCGDTNFKKRTECRRCKTSKYAPRTGVGASPRSGSGTSSSTAVPTPKPGDKLCTGCGEINFASRDRCRKCGGNLQVLNLITPEIRNQSLNRTMNRQDWTCSDPTCREVNFGFRHICRKCNKLKPDFGHNVSNIVPIADRISEHTSTIRVADNVGTDDESSICVVCLTDPRTHAITTCGHMCFCGVCGFNMKMCPICRTQYDPDKKQLIKIYNC